MNNKSAWRYLAAALAGATFTLLVMLLWPHQSSDLDHDEDAIPAASEHPQAKTEVRAITLSSAQLATNGIRIETAASGPLASALTLSGQLVLDADHEAKVLTPVSGIVREIRVQTGAQVSTGSELAVLESRELADVNSQYLAARERRALASASFSREEGLWQKKISAEQDYLQAKKDLAEADIELGTALQKLLALGVPMDEAQHLKINERLARYALRAPIDGTVLSRDLTLGEAVASEKSVFHVADLRTLWVDLAVPIGDLPSIKTGQLVVICDTANTLEGEGKVLFIQPELDNTTRAGSVRVVIDNHTGQWRAGMAVNAELITGPAGDALSVPTDALQLLNDKPIVFVHTEDGLVPREVSVGRKAAGRVEIMSGLKVGDQYAAGASFVLKSEWQKGEAKDED